MPQQEEKLRRPRIRIHETWTINKEEFSFTENPDVPEALMAFAEQVRGNAGARISVTTDFSMKDYGNGAGASVTISLDCNQDDNTMQQVFAGLSQWGTALAEQHYKAADQKFQQMLAQQTGKPPAFGG